MLCSLVNGQPEGGPCSRIDKLKAALQLHLPDQPDSAIPNTKFLSRLLMHVQNTWGINLGEQETSVEDASLQEAQQPEDAVKQQSPVHESNSASQQHCHESQQHAENVALAKVTSQVDA